MMKKKKSESSDCIGAQKTEDYALAEEMRLIKRMSIKSPLVRLMELSFISNS